MPILRRLSMPCVLSAIAAASSAFAAGQPVASLTRVSGIVRAIPAGTQAAAVAKTGDPLAAGDQVVTEDGRAEITFAQGHILRLNANTTLEVVPPANPATKTHVVAKLFAMLFKGSIKALVKPVDPHEGFAIQSVQAIASVKGTVFIMADGTVLVQDEGDPQPHQVEITDPNTGRSFLVSEGQAGGFNGDGSPNSPHAFTEQEFQQRDQQIEGGGNVGSPPAGTPPAGTPPAGQSPPPTTPPPGPSADDGRGDLHGELGDFAGSHDLGQQTDQNNRVADTMLGAVQLDRHGNRVRIEKEVKLLSSAANTNDTIEYDVRNFRDGGPSAGLTALQSTFTFNQSLPTDGFQDVRRGLAAAFADNTQAPAFWLTGEHWQVVGPDNHEVATDVVFGPVQGVYRAWITANLWNASTNTWTYSGPVGPQSGWSQGFDYKRSLGTVGALALMEHFQVNFMGDIEGGWYAGISHPASETYDPALLPPNQAWVWSGQSTQWSAGPDPNTGLYYYDPNAYAYDSNTLTYVYYGTPFFNNGFFGSGTRTLTTLGSFIQAEHVVYGDGNTFDMTRFVVDTQGHEQDLNALLPNGVSEAAVHGLGPNFSYEVEFKSSIFGVDSVLDILSDPAFFDEAAPVNPNSNDQNGGHNGSASLG